MSTKYCADELPRHVVPLDLMFVVQSSVLAFAFLTHLVKLPCKMLIVIFHCQLVNHFLILAARMKTLYE